MKITSRVIVEEIGEEKLLRTGEVSGYVNLYLHTNIGTRYEKRERVLLKAGEMITMERQGMDEEVIEKLVETSEVLAKDFVDDVMEKVRANTRTKRK